MRTSNLAGKKCHIIIVLNRSLGRRTTNWNVSTYCTRAVALLNHGSPTLLLLGEKATTITVDWLARGTLKNHNNWYIEDSKLVRTSVVRKKIDA
jgi:hypothetical protein